MELPAKYKVLIATLQPRTFTQIAEYTRLSPATISKWLKIHMALGNIVNNGTIYEITDMGKAILKEYFTEIASKALDLGLVKEITLYITPNDARLQRDTDGTIVLQTIHVGGDSELEETKVNINLGDDIDEIKNLFTKLTEEANTLTD